MLATSQTNNYQSILPSTEPSDEKDDGKNRIGTFQLAILVFYVVSGGPYGTEDSVRSGGVYWALLGFAVMPFVWSLPEALMTAELGCAFPEASGNVVWVEAAFGPYAGWISGCLKWVAGATDNSVYPGLFLDYLLKLLFASERDPVTPLVHFFIVLLISIILSYVNYRGLPVVGNLSITISLLTMGPFILFCLMAIPHVKPSRWLQTPTYVEGQNFGFDLSGGFFPNTIVGGVMVRPFLNNLYWCLNSFDSAGNFAGDVKHPQEKTFSRGMLWGLAFVAMSYLLPLLMATGVADAPQSAWVNGYLETVTYSIGGPILGLWLVFGAAICNIGRFEAELSSDSFLLMGMADRGYLPKFLSHRSPYGTPTVGILISFAVIILCLTKGLSTVVAMENCCYTVYVSCIRAAYVISRVVVAGLLSWSIRPSFGCEFLNLTVRCF